MNHLSRPLCPHAQFSSKAWQDMPPASPSLDVCQFLSILCKMLGLPWNAGLIKMGRVARIAHSQVYVFYYASIAQSGSLLWAAAAARWP